MIASPSDAWPTFIEPADEWAGEEWLDDRLPTDHANHLRWGGKLSRTEYDRQDSAFLEGLRRRLRGEAVDLGALAAPLAVSDRIIHDKRPMLPAPEEVSDALLADIALDWIGEACPDRVLGPWSDGASRELACLAAAAQAFVPYWADCLMDPAQRWERPKPRATPSLRAAVRAVGFAPTMLWTPDWRPLLPLAPRFLPQGPVRASVIPLVPGRVEAIVARVYPGPAGPTAALALGLPAVPPTGPLLARLRVEILRDRRHERRRTWEDLLRQRGELLHRLCAGYAWWEGGRA